MRTCNRFYIKIILICWNSETLLAIFEELFYEDTSASGMIRINHPNDVWFQYIEKHLLLKVYNVSSE